MNVLEKILEEMENRVNFRKRLVRYEKKKGTITDVVRNQGALEELVIVEKIICSHMDETISEMEKVEKEKVTSAEIISREIDGKPYYEIKFKKVGEDEYTIGYSSFKLDYVIKWLNDYFALCGEAKVSCENDRDGKMNILEKILEKIEHEAMTNKEIGRKQCEGIARAMNIIRKYTDEKTNINISMIAAINKEMEDYLFEKYCVEGFDEELDRIFKKYLELGKDTNVGRKSDWIPVEEKPSEKPVFGEDSYIVQTNNIITPFSAFWDGEEWTDVSDDKVKGVIAWQPLPKRYKGK